MSVQIHESWKKVLANEFEKPYFPLLKQAILADKKKGKTIYPTGKNIFNAYNSTPFEQVKVVIIGQDPYHGPGQAHGLSFSVPKDIKTPPSLQNIFKELHADLGVSIPHHGNLHQWANQGVLLLNAILTVRAREAASHRNIGWENFTNATIQAISNDLTHVVFLLWGRFAQKKAALIDSTKHLILEAAHPSPFSAHNGFFGCKHFSLANQYLVQHNQSPINWQIK